MEGLPSFLWVALRGMNPAATAEESPTTTEAEAFSLGANSRGPDRPSAGGGPFLPPEAD